MHSFDRHLVSSRFSSRQPLLQNIRCVSNSSRKNVAISSTWSMFAKETSDVPQMGNVGPKELGTLLSWVFYDRLSHQSERQIFFENLCVFGFNKAQNKMSKPSNLLITSGITPFSLAFYIGFPPSSLLLSNLNQPTNQPNLASQPPTTPNQPSISIARATSILVVGSSKLPRGTKP